jgi:hypothetical protein
VSKKYSELAAKRYRLYIWQKEKESLVHALVTLVLRILQALVRKLLQLKIRNAHRVEKLNVEGE